MPESKTSETAALLASAGVPAWVADALPAHLGVAGAELGEDPWALLALPGLRPEQADAFARASLGPAARPDDPRRTRAIVAWLLERAARDGHTAMPAGTVRSVLGGFGVPDPAAGVEAALDDGGVMAFTAFTATAPTTATTPGGDGGPVNAAQDLLALDRYALAEDSAAESVLRLLATVPGAASRFPEPAGHESLAPVLSAGIGVLLRGPGPAGDAAVAALRRLAEAAGLVADVITPRTGHEGGPGTANAAGVFIVDDAQLLDVEVAAGIADAVADGARLVLAGDPAQLSSAGPGAVFRDVIASGVVPVVGPGGGHAEHGTGPGADRSPRPVAALGELADAIRGGVLPVVNSPDRELVVVPAGSAGEAAHRAVQLVTDSIPRALGIDVAEIQVVVPARRGRSGTAALNAALKARLNPGPGEFAGFDVGDRITAKGLRTQAGLTLGEAGIVVDKIADGLVLRVGDRQVTVERPAEVLEHGWAITVRQAQGSRWPALVAVLSGEAAGMLSRPLVYTAVTRAQRHLSVVAAAGAALARAVAAVPERSRCTRLEGLLRQEG